MNKNSSVAVKQKTMKELGFNVKSKYVEEVYNNIFAQARYALKKDCDNFSLFDIFNENSDKIKKLFEIYFTMNLDAGYLNTFLQITNYSELNPEYLIQKLTVLKKNDPSLFVVKSDKAEIKEQKELFYFFILLIIKKEKLSYKKREISFNLEFSRRINFMERAIKHIYIELNMLTKLQLIADNTKIRGLKNSLVGGTIEFSDHIRSIVYDEIIEKRKKEFNYGEDKYNKIEDEKNVETLKDLFLEIEKTFFS